MLPLAHLGIGSTIASPLSKQLPKRWLLLGTMLPDLIDKPLFFLMGIYAHYQHGGWVPGKRGLAHTLIFLILLFLAGYLKKSRPVKAVALGTATHLILDVLSKAFGNKMLIGALTVLFWPFMGWGFPVLSYGVHGKTAFAFEVIGGILLVVFLYRNRFEVFRSSRRRVGSK